MAIGVVEIKSSGRLVFALTRGGETTTRSVEIPYPIDDEEAEGLQEKVDSANATFTSDSMKYFMQPANWRDNNDAEEQWETTSVHYEIVQTTVTPINATPASLGSAQQGEQQ